jgi:hypothetical protein
MNGDVGNVAKGAKGLGGLPVRMNVRCLNPGRTRDQDTA